MSESGLVPVILVTGFLGSGKTTFINWLLHKFPERKISLILNEFGDISLESRFVKETVHGQVAELANGCMCCVAKSDIPRVVKYILETAPHTEAIIIEASGLSDPDPVAASLASEELSKLINLNTIICIVDALNFLDHRKDNPIVMSQLGDCDIALITKVHEAGEKQLGLVKLAIDSLGIGIKHIDFKDDLDHRAFLELKFDHESEAESEHHHDHSHEEYSEVWVSINKPVKRLEFAEKVRNLPNEVIRAKGCVNFSDSTPSLIQYVGRRLQVLESDGLPKDSNMLFLGKGLNKEAIDKLFNS